jgi:hypothetical protein
MDRVLIQRVVDALNRVCEARHRRVSEERHSVSVMTFVFLMMLAIFTFYGVAFLQMGSGGLISSVIVMTGLSLLMSMAVLVRLLVALSSLHASAVCCQAGFYGLASMACWLCGGGSLTCLGMRCGLPRSVCGG